MSGPAVVVVAGFVTLWLALGSDDGLVAEDYYKRGLAINKLLGRVEAGARDGLEARVVLAAGSAQVRVHGLVDPPASLRLAFTHPTRAGLDRVVEVRLQADGHYRADVGDLPAGRWRVTLEAPEWKLHADVPLPGESAILRP
jgi:hypothetical protein